MTEYTIDEKNQARRVLGIKRQDGPQPVPMKERSREALLDTIEILKANHADRIEALAGAEKALFKRLKDHRKAKALANKRADAAVAMMHEMLAHFEEGKT